MKKIMIAIAMLLVATPILFAQTKAGKQDTTKHEPLYSCPMHSRVTMTAPGRCSICGMDPGLSGKEQMKAGVTKNYNCPSHFPSWIHDQTQCPKCGRKSAFSPKEQMKAEAVKLQTCPMHPLVALNKDGVCVKCIKAS